MPVKTLMFPPPFQKVVQLKLLLKEVKCFQYKLYGANSAVRDFPPKSCPPPLLLSHFVSWVEQVNLPDTFAKAYKVAMQNPISIRCIVFVKLIKLIRGLL